VTLFAADHYLSAANGKLYCLSEKDGSSAKREWKNSLRGTGFNPVTLTADESKNTVFAATNGSIFSIDITTGKDKLKRLDLRHYFTMALLLHEDILYAGTNGHLFAIQSTTFNILWDIQLPSEGSGVGFAMLLHKSDEKNSLVVVAHRCYIHGVGLDGKALWSHRLHKAAYTYASLLPHENNLIFIFSEAHLFACNPQNGNLYWQAEVHGLGYSSVSAATKHTYIQSIGNDPLLQFHTEPEQTILSHHA